MNSPSTPKARSYYSSNSSSIHVARIGSHSRSSNKRGRSAWTSASANSNNAASSSGSAYKSPSSMAASCSLFDCQSLQKSLKRVRLSSSPGELRLQRDLRHAVVHDRWVPVDDNEWHLRDDGGVGGGGSAAAGETCSSSAALFRTLEEEPNHDGSSCSNSIPIIPHVDDDESLQAHSSLMYPQDSQLQQQLGWLPRQRRASSDDDGVFALDPAPPPPPIVSNETTATVSLSSSSSSSYSSTTTATPTIGMLQMSLQRHAHDPLRFQLVIPEAGCTLGLQIPRLYPHHAPAIRSVVYSHSNSTGSHNHHCHFLQTNSMSTSKNTTTNINMVQLQAILIASQPDDPVLAVAQACPGATAVVTNWTPLTRLSSLLETLRNAVLGRADPHCVTVTNGGSSSSNGMSRGNTDMTRSSRQKWQEQSSLMHPTRRALTSSSLSSSKRARPVMSYHCHEQESKEDDHRVLKDDYDEDDTFRVWTSLTPDAKHCKNDRHENKTTMEADRATESTPSAKTTSDCHLNSEALDRYHPQHPDHHATKWMQDDNHHESMIMTDDCRSHSRPPPPSHQASTVNLLLQPNRFDQGYPHSNGEDLGHTTARPRHYPIPADSSMAM